MIPHPPSSPLLRLLTMATVAGAALLCAAGPADARQWPSGHISLLFDYLPDRDHAGELRSRVYLEEEWDPEPSLRVTASGFAEALLARRTLRRGESGRVTDAIVKLHEAHAEFSTRRLDLLVGRAITVWGRLDELQPTDVINPLDASRFFFEGRGEARLPVTMLRARMFLSEGATLEGIYVPAWRGGRFDQLDEASSPFNLAAALWQDPVACQAIGCPAVVAVDRRDPELALRNAQGGARLSVTMGRVDWSVSAYRGIESLGLLGIDPLRGLLVESFPRFTMIGGDFETVRGRWAIRGEAAVFPEDSFQSREPRVVAGHSFDAGLGVDRRAGDYTISGTLLVHSEAYDAPLATARSSEERRLDVSLIASADRTFARERYRLRTFGVYNVSEASAFLRAIAIMSLRDNVALEASLGWFIGSGEDLVGRFARNDFAYLRIRYHF